MWLDDDGDDDSLSGPLPDPSTRHWRHPSEVGAQNAKNLENSAGVPGGAAYPAIGSANTKPWRWPAGAIGGGLFVAAIGVLGLSLTDGTSSEVLSTGTLPAGTAPVAAISPAQPDPSSGTEEDASSEQTDNAAADQSSEQPESSPTTSTTAATSPRPPSDSGSSESGPSTSGPTTTVLLSTSVAPQSTSRPSTPDLATGRAGESPDIAAIDPEILDEASATAEQLKPLMAPAPGLTAPFGAGVYASTNLTEPLASFVPVEGHILTSAAALGGRDHVYLLIDETWIWARVAATHPETDVAVLTVDPAVWEVGLPTAITIPIPAKSGTDVFVGYCPTELAIGTTTTTLSDESADTTGEAPREKPPVPAGRCPAEPGQDGQERLKQRLGTIWSTARSVERLLTNHNVYDPIKTVVPNSVGMAGSALRDLVGDVVGLVMSADNPSVAALPIDRAVAVADALLSTGSGSATWLGVEGSDDPGGVLVTVIEDNSPAADVLEPGDLIMAIDGRRVVDMDYLMYRVRQSGDDVSASLTVKRADTIQIFVIPMAKTPPLEQEE